MTEALLKLFKACHINNSTYTYQVFNEQKIKYLMSETIGKGYIIAPSVMKEYDCFAVTSYVDDLYGKDCEKLNSSFHKSWNKIHSLSDAGLRIEQIAHYVTTYGKQGPLSYLQEEKFNVTAKDVFNLLDFEPSKMWDKDYFYIPKEVLDIPEITEDIKLVIIKGLTTEQIIEKVMNLCSGIALKEETINDVVSIMTSLGIKNFDLDKIKNKELSTIIYHKTETCPSDSVEFLRLLIYKTTGKTLIIKNCETIAAIKEGVKNRDLNIYKYNYDIKELSKTFYRFKPLWLAFRTSIALRPVINRIRRLAIKYHEPMKSDYLNNVTYMLKNREPLASLENELSKVNIFRKIRLMYALNYYKMQHECFTYKIRNGKSYSKQKDMFDFPINEAEKQFNIVRQSIIEDLRQNVEGKTVYIPEYMKYALPATEKQFTGNIPSLSYISIPNDMIFGIYWENVDNHRIDLDLSLLNTKKIGWDSAYKNEDILFSGDMTDAEHGAAELFYIKNNCKSESIVLCNFYNYQEDIEVPFKIIVAQEKTRDFKKNYMVDPSNVLISENTKMDKQQKVLGVVVSDELENRFYFSESSMGSSITSSNKEHVNYAKSYLLKYTTSPAILNDLLLEAGTKMTKYKAVADIDLSPEALEKDTFMQILNGKQVANVK